MRHLQTPGSQGTTPPTIVTRKVKSGQASRMPMPQVPSRFRRHILYAVLISLMAVVAGYKGVLPVFRSYLLDYLGIGDRRFGFLFSIYSMTGLCSVLFGGQLIDRYGPRRVIHICMAGVGAAMLMIAAAGPSFALFALAFAVGGLFASPLFIAISAYLTKLFPRHQRRIISLNLASTSIGGMMFPALAEGLLRLTRGSEGIAFRHVLHMPFLLTGTCMIAVAFVYRTRKEIRPAASGGSVFTPRRWHWCDLLLPPRLWIMALLISLHGLADTTLYLWMSRFLESTSFERMGLAPGFVLTGYSFSYLLARGTLAILPERFGQKAFLVFPGLIGGCLLVAMICTRSYPLMALGYVLGGFCWSTEYPAMVSTLMRYGKKRFGAAMAFSGLLVGIMMFLGMNAMGFFVEWAGEGRMWMAMLVPAGLFCVIGLGGSLWLWCYGGGTEVLGTEIIER